MTSDRVDWWRLGTSAARLVPQLPHMARALPYLLDTPIMRATDLGTAVERTASRFPERRAIWSEHATYTWRAVDTISNRLGRALRNEGLQPGMVVGLHCSNRPEVLHLITAVSKLGATIALFNTLQVGRALAHSVEVSKAEFIIAEHADPEMWAGHHVCELNTLYAAAQHESAAQIDDISAPERSDAAFYIFTSGTTGLPKASVMSHRRWLKAAFGYGYGMLRLNEEDVLYNALPLYHNLAMTIGFGSCVATGACFAISARFSASKFWEECRESGATCITYIGELPRYLLAQPATHKDQAHRVRLATGVGLRHSLWDEFKQRFGIDRVAEFYGSSEGNTVFVNLFGIDQTVGFSPTPYVLVVCDADSGEPIRDTAGHLVKAPTGSPGLLLSRVTKRFPYDGYTDPEASEQRLFHNPFGKGHTYLNSGDLLRKIGCGHAVFVDRVGDTFRWKGENVATAEVEAVLDDVSYIRESTVYGVQLDDTDGKPGMAALACDYEQLDVEGLYQHCRAHLPEYAVPVYLRIQSALSLTGTFKHQRSKVRSLGLQHTEDSVLMQRTGDTPWTIVHPS